VRIAVVTRNGRVVGGVETYLDTVIPRLEAAGHEISLFCERDAPFSLQAIGHSANAPTSCVTEMGAARSFESLRRWQPDLIYSHGLDDIEMEARAHSLGPAIVFAHDYGATGISGTKTFAFPASSPCMRRLGAGCVANLYPRRCGGVSPLSMFADFPRASQRLTLLRNVRAVLTASRYMRDEYVRNGRSPEAVHCVGLPIADSGAVQPMASDNTGSESSANPLKLLFAGRMEPLKGVRILLEALPLIASALSRSLVLTLAGDGRLRLELARRAVAIVRSYPTLRIEFTGWINSVALTSLFDSSDLLVVPSLWTEPFGLVGPEAGARESPAAAFATGGIPEWLTDGANGALAKNAPPTSTNLANAIVRCLRDPAEHARLRRGAIELAKRFSPERHLQALMKIIDLTSSQSSASGAAATTPCAP
jgi:glycosyltransferase involved in cell wall biosynthesis